VGETDEVWKMGSRTQSWKAEVGRAPDLYF